MANGQLIVKLTIELMRSGKAKSWSHAMAQAADAVKQQATKGKEQ